MYVICTCSHKYTPLQVISYKGTCIGNLYNLQQIINLCAYLKGDLLYGWWLAGVLEFKAEGQVIFLHHIPQLLGQTTGVLQTVSWVTVSLGFVDSWISFTGVTVLLGFG